MAKRLEIQFCVPDGYKYLIAELHYENEHFGELNTENGHLQLLLFPRPSAAAWAIPLEVALDGLHKAQSQLQLRSTFFAAQTEQ